MDNIKNDKFYLDKTKKHFERIISVTNKISYDKYIKDVDLQDITMFNLIQISENINKISLEYKDKHKDIPWTDIYGLRNRIVHDYGNVVLDVIYQTISVDIPSLYKKLFK